MPPQEPPKDRNEYIYATTKGDVTEIIVSVNELTGEISFGSEMTNVYSEVNYDRPKGPKVLSRIPQTDAKLSFDAGRVLWKNFDCVYAVDTNTKIIQDRVVSVVGIVRCDNVWVPEPNGLTRYARFDMPFCLEFIGIKLKPENFGWAAALEHLRERGHINQRHRVGLVVDSDLGNLADYNNRRKPFNGPDFLPRNVQLVYATADSGKDYFLNRFFAVADSVASQCLGAIENGDVPFNRKSGASAWFETSRILYPNSLGTPA